MKNFLELELNCPKCLRYSSWVKGDELPKINEDGSYSCESCNGKIFVPTREKAKVIFHPFLPC